MNTNIPDVRLMPVLAAGALLIMAFTIRSHAPELIWIGHVAAVFVPIILVYALVDFYKRNR